MTDAEIVKTNRPKRPELWTYCFLHGRGWQVYQYASESKQNVLDASDAMSSDYPCSDLIRIPPEGEQQIDWKVRAVELANAVLDDSISDFEDVRIIAQKIISASKKATATP